MNRHELMDLSCPASHFLRVQERWVQQNSAPATEPVTIGTPPSSGSPRRRFSQDDRVAALSASAPSASASAAVCWELVPGAVGGFCSVLVGHPLDLLKVRMQAGGGGGAAPTRSAPPAPLRFRGAPNDHDGYAHRRMTGVSALGRGPHPTVAFSQSTRPARVGQPGLWNVSASQALHWTRSVAPRSAGVASSMVEGAGAGAPAHGPSSPSSGAATLRDVARDVVRRNGVRGLYAGMTAPLLAVVPAFGVTIGTFEASKRHLISIRRDPHPHHHHPQHASQQQQLTLWETAAAGAASGVLAAFVLGPLEKVKCEFQLHPNRYRSFLDCLRVQLSGAPPHLHPATLLPPRLGSWSVSHPSGSPRPSAALFLPGRIRALFRGTFLTMGRDVPGNAAYFAVYESARRSLLASSSSSYFPDVDGDDASTSSRQRRLTATVVAGGIAGVVNWCLILPVDVVKTRWQTCAPGEYASPIQLLRIMLREGGIAHLYRGLGPAVLRAFPSNAAALCAVDLTRQALERPSP